jgi:phytoene/squalene synthetase
MLAYLHEFQLTEVGSEMAQNRNDVADIRMDADGLYREEAFTDRRVGTLQQLLPITADGQPDATRPVLFVGQTQVLTPAGALPLSFEIEASTLQEAVARFGDHAREALADTMQRLEEMRREAASSIIVPSGGMPGSPPGGRNIQMP